MTRALRNISTTLGLEPTARQLPYGWQTYYENVCVTPVNILSCVDVSFSVATNTCSIATSTSPSPVVVGTATSVSVPFDGLLVPRPCGVDVLSTGAGGLDGSHINWTSMAQRMGVANEVPAHSAKPF